MWGFRRLKLNKFGIILAALIVILAFSAHFATNNGIADQKNNYSGVYYQSTEESFIKHYNDSEDILEAKTEDWVSFHNPRDAYYYNESEMSDLTTEEIDKKYPGSAKICIALMNERKDPILGETLPNTTIKFPFDGLEWHESTPWEVELPLSNYERPLDSDQLGTTKELPQGDGYLDSHCIEAHYLNPEFNLNYNELEIEGEHSEDLDVLGYREHLDSWRTDLNIKKDFQKFGESNISDGQIKMEKNKTHLQVMAIAQLNRNKK